MSNKITEMIDQLVLEKTVSLDALNAINELKRHAQILDDQVKERDRLHMEDAETIRQLRDQINDLNLSHQNVAQMLDQERKKVEHALKVEQEGKESKAELKGFREAMQMVFKPSAVRETIHKTVPVAVEGNPGGNGSYASPGFVTLHPESGTIERTAE